MKLKNLLLFSFLFIITNCFGGGSGNNSSSSNSFELKNKAQLEKTISNLPSPTNGVSVNLSALSPSDIADIMYSVVDASLTSLEGMRESLSVLDQAQNAETPEELNQIEGLSASNNPPQVKINLSNNFQSPGFSGSCDGSYKLTGLINETTFRLDGKSSSQCRNYKTNFRNRNGALKSLTKEVTLSNLELSGRFYEHLQSNGSLQNSPLSRVFNGEFVFSGDYQGKLVYTIQQTKQIFVGDILNGSNYSTVGAIIIEMGGERVTCDINSNVANNITDILLSSVCGNTNDINPINNNSNNDNRFNPNSPNNTNTNNNTNGNTNINNNMNPIDQNPSSFNRTFDEEFLRKFSEIPNPITNSDELNNIDSIENFTNTFTNRIFGKIINNTYLAIDRDEIDQNGYDRVYILSQDGSNDQDNNCKIELTGTYDIHNIDLECSDYQAYPDDHSLNDTHTNASITGSASIQRLGENADSYSNAVSYFLLLENSIGVKIAEEKKLFIDNRDYEVKVLLQLSNGDAYACFYQGKNYYPLLQCQTYDLGEYNSFINPRQPQDGVQLADEEIYQLYLNSLREEFGNPEDINPRSFALLQNSMSNLFTRISETNQQEISNTNLQGMSIYEFLGTEDLLFIKIYIENMFNQFAFEDNVINVFGENYDNSPTNVINNMGYQQHNNLPQLFTRDINVNFPREGIDQPCFLSKRKIVFKFGLLEDENGELEEERQLINCNNFTLPGDGNILDINYLKTSRKDDLDGDNSYDHSTELYEIDMYITGPFEMKLHITDLFSSNLFVDEATYSNALMTFKSGNKTMSCTMIMPDQTSIFIRDCFEVQ